MAEIKNHCPCGADYCTHVALSAEEVNEEIIEAGFKTNEWGIALSLSVEHLDTLITNTPGLEYTASLLPQNQAPSHIDQEDLGK